MQGAMNGVKSEVIMPVAAQLASTSSSVSVSLPNSLRVHELDKQHEHKLHGRKLPQFPVFGQLSSSRGAALPNHRGIYLEKRTNLLNFRINDSRVYTRRIGLQERWTKETVSVAATFFRRCSRVGKNPGLRRWPDNAI